MKVWLGIFIALAFISAVSGETEINVNFSNMLSGFANLPTTTTPTPSPTPSPTVTPTTAPTPAAVVRAPLPYQDGAKELEGVLFYRPNSAPAPGLVIVHDWNSINRYTLFRGQQYAELGFTVLLADIYGKGARNLTNADRVSNATLILSNRTLAKTRMLAAYNALKNHPAVDNTRLAVLGYCFGGTVALELARSGQAPDVRALVSFHGDPQTPNPQDNLNIPNTTTVGIFHGQLDSIPLNSAVNITRQIQQNGGDAFFESYSDAVHAFTDFTDPTRYNKRADVRSFAGALALFQERDLLPSATFYRGAP